MLFRSVVVGVVAVGIVVENNFVVLLERLHKIGFPELHSLSPLF